LLMAETRAYLRLLARTNREVEGILTQANRMISEDVDGERYVTAVFVSLDPERRVIECASAGHTPGFVISRKGAIKAKLTRTGVPLGMRFDSPYGKGESVTLESGDIVLLATDGIDEAVNAENEFYGLDAAVRVVHENRDAPAAEIVERLYESVKAFADGAPIEDDVTAMVIKAL